MTARTTAPTGAPSPADLLLKLDQWMNAAQYGADHPWRLSIAETLAAHPAQADASEPEPLDALEITNRLWDVHGLVLATVARAWQLEDKTEIESDRTEPLRRLCRVTAEMVEKLAGDVLTDSAFAAALRQRSAANVAKTEGGAV